MYFIDVQGTIISDTDKSAIPGAIEFIKHLDEQRTPYMIITNNTKQASDLFYEYLKGLGFTFPFSHYLDPLMLLEQTLQKESVAAYGSKEFLVQLGSMGYKFDYETPKSVLLAIKEDYTSEEFAQIIDFLLAGSTLVGMHETAIYAKNSKRYPGVGAILKMLEYATSASYSVVGKPSVAFYDEALERLRLQNPHARFEDITIISDDVKGDIIGAQELGMRGVFVLSGKYQNADEIIPYLAQSERPDAIFKDIKAIMEAQ